MSDQIQTGDACQHGIRGRCAVCEATELAALAEEMLATLKALGQRMDSLLEWVAEEMRKDEAMHNIPAVRVWSLVQQKLAEFPPTPACELRVLFDGPPGNESGRFIECENDRGQGVDAGAWRERPDGFWELVITEVPARRPDFPPTWTEGEDPDG